MIGRLIDEQTRRPAGLLGRLVGIMMEIVSFIRQLPE